MSFYLLLLAVIILLTILGNLVTNRSIIFTYAQSITLNTKGKKDKISKFFLASFVMLTFFAAIRASSVGTDSFIYSIIFTQIGNTQDIFNVISSAPVYAIYNKIIYLAFPFKQTIFIANAIIISIGIAWFIRSYSCDFGFSTILYFEMFTFCYSLNGMRQSLAMSLFLIAVCFLKKGLRLQCAIFAFLALGTHNTVLIAIPILFLYSIRLNKKNVVIISTATIIFAFVLKSVYLPAINWFVSIFPRYGMYFSTVTNDIFFESQGRNIYLTIFYAVIVFCALFVYLYESKVNTLADEHNRGLQYLLIPSLISVCIGLAWADNFTLYRIREYYSIFIICLMPNFYRLFGKHHISAKVITVILLLIPFTILLSENKNDIVPYVFFWDAK